MMAKVNFIKKDEEKKIHKAEVGDFLLVNFGGGKEDQLRMIAKTGRSFVSISENGGYAAKGDSVEDLIKQYEEMCCEGGKLIIVPADRVTITVDMEGLN